MTVQEFRSEWVSEISQRRVRAVGSVEKGECSTSTIVNTETESRSKTQNEVVVCNSEDLYNLTTNNVVLNSQNTGNSLNNKSIITKQTEYIPFVIVDNLLNDGCLNIDKNTNFEHNKFKRKFGGPIIDYKHNKHTTGGLNKKNITNEDLVMRLVSDFNEITEIPFFDIDLPRELALKIFAYLSVQDLCHCCQVSRSWRSLSEDGLLWQQIARRLALEGEITGSRTESCDWKQFVTDGIERQYTLIVNWKGRIGQLEQIAFVQGGVLQAVDVLLSHNMIVAGYSSGHVRLVDLSNNDSCIFTPSNVALEIDESCDQGTVSNDVRLIKTCPRYTVAAYSQGNIDVWCNKGGAEVIHNFTCSTAPTSLQISQTEPTVIAASYGCHLVTHVERETAGFKLLEDISVHKPIVNLQLFENDEHECMVVIATSDVVRLHRPGDRAGHMTELHNMIYAPVTSVDVSYSTRTVAVGVNTCTQQGYKVKLYTLEHGRLLHDLAGHTWIVSCINIKDSPHHCLVTGCGDRRVRMYDVRTGHSPVSTLVGHLQCVTSVQMDEWKVVSGDEGGLVCVWDQRVERKLWEWHNRHPVAFCRFHDSALYLANIPCGDACVIQDMSDSIVHRRHRGSIQTYDFLSDQSTPGLPDVCLSSYNVPEAYNYNIRLTMPYDAI